MEYAPPERMSCADEDKRPSELQWALAYRPVYVVANIMPTWRRIFLRAAGFGVGVAAILAVVIGALTLTWYEGRPSPPKPWRKDQLKATYNKIGNSHDKNTIEFMYFLENTTNEDYRIDGSKDVHLAFILGDLGSLGPVDRFADLDTPVYIPAKHTAQITIKLKANLKHVLKNDPTDEEQSTYLQAVAEYLTKDLIGLNGFSLFDDRHRYEVTFPPGWKGSDH